MSRDLIFRSKLTCKEYVWHTYGNLWNTCGILDYCTSEMKAFDERSQLLKFEVLETGNLDSTMLSPTTFFSTWCNIRNIPSKVQGSRQGGNRKFRCQMVMFLNSVPHDDMMHGPWGQYAWRSRFSSVRRWKGLKRYSPSTFYTSELNQSFSIALLVREMLDIADWLSAIVRYSSQTGETKPVPKSGLRRMGRLWQIKGQCDDLKISEYPWKSRNEYLGYLRGQFYQCVTLSCKLKSFEDPSKRHRLA